MNGEGTIHRCNGETLTRVWENNVQGEGQADCNGNFTEKFIEDGAEYTYVGKKSGGVRSGDGSSFFSTGLIAYQGNWAGNNKHGEGREYLSKPSASRDPNCYKDFNCLH